MYVRIVVYMHLTSIIAKHVQKLLPQNMNRYVASVLTSSDFWLDSE
jgi:hypothetical protein